MKILNRNNCFEIICFLLFCACTIFISIYHEPWRDEFQDWAISKDSLYNILFVIPHFDGHCPFWYLILKCFSVFSINPELGIKIPNLFFMFCAIWLLIFKSPFPKIIKFLLPFTYFIFYQYSIISRPYSIFCFGIFLAAYSYKDKDKNPLGYIFALSLMSLSNAFGMVIAAGIIIVWLVEILKKEKLNFVKNFYKDKRFYSMFFIFLLCLLILLSCVADKNASFYPHGMSISKFLYLFFALPQDSLISDIAYYSPLVKINILNVIIGTAIYTVLFLIFRFYKSLMLFFIPYTLFLISAYLVYFCGHHIGMVVLFYIFVFWCILSKNNIKINKKYKPVISLLILIPVLTQIYWSFCAYCNEYRYNYSYSRDLSNYIKENRLTEYNTMSYFSKYNYNVQYAPVVINPYFNKNVFYNFNIFSPDKEYIVWEKMNEQEKELAYRKLKSRGFPEVIIGDIEFLAIDISKENPFELKKSLNVINQVFLSEIFEINEKEIPEYKVAKIINYSQIWKKRKFNYVISVLLRGDIYQKTVK